jgi:hypothetical protein
MMSSDKKAVKIVNQAPGGFVLFLAFIGAAIYFVQHTSGGFWEVILALLKAIVWPVFVVYHALHLLGA